MTQPDDAQTTDQPVPAAAAESILKGDLGKQPSQVQSDPGMLDMKGEDHSMQQEETHEESPLPIQVPTPALDYDESKQKDVSFHNSTRDVQKSTSILSSVRSSASPSGFLHSAKLCWQRWPRTVAILGKVLLLWALILWALCFGFVLSRIEGPSEVETNDQILAQRWVYRALPLQEMLIAIVNLPTACMDKFVSEELLGEEWLDYGFNNPNHSGPVLVPGLVNPDAIVNNYTIAWIEQMMRDEFSKLEGFQNITVPEVPKMSDNATTEEILEGLHDYLELCEETALNMIEYSYDAIQEIALENLDVDVENVAAEALSFNWIRCWDNTLLGNPNPWSPTPEQVNASAYQVDFFIEQWNLDQKRKQDQYIEDRDCNGFTLNATRNECILDAIADSVTNATGGRDCDTNTGSSAWFWFTVMTTVGYGNQSPVTTGGRALVGALGWLSIIVFAGIIVYSAGNWIAVADDFFYRLNWKRLQQPLYSAIFWAILSIAWIARLASKARAFWRDRIPGFEATEAESYWFAYISTLTVGLGDFYLQPEGMFVADVFSWSSGMLTGFVLVSTFLGKVGDLISSWLPTEAESFGEYLKRTDFWSGKVIAPPESTEIKVLRDMVEEEQAIDNGKIKLKGEDLYTSAALTPDGKTFNEKKIEMLKEKKEILTKILEDTEAEMEHRITQASRHGEPLSQSGKV